MTPSIGNRLILAIVHSPLQAMLGPEFASIEFAGGRSGRVFELPVNVLAEEDGFLIISRSHRTWWRNLRSGPVVTLRHQGQVRRLRPQVIEDPSAVAKVLRGYLQKKPRHVRTFGISIEPGGEPNPDHLARASKERVFVRLRPE